MNIWLILAAVLGCCSLGVISITRRRTRHGDRLAFAAEFLERYLRLVADPARGDVDYVWLMQRAVRMQSDLGDWGVISYKPPFGAYIHNYPVVLNTLPQIGDRHIEPVMQRRVADQILMYSGTEQDRLAECQANLRNPIVWLRDGVRVILLVPAFVLWSLGLLSRTTLERLSQSTLLRFIAALIAMVSFIGTVIGLMVDWDGFRRLIGW